MTSDNKTKNETLIETFCNSYCIICKKRIAVCCGTPLIKIGGCCSGVMDDENKTFYCRDVTSHFYCYVNATTKKAQQKLNKTIVKTKWNLKEIKKIVRDK